MIGIGPKNKDENFQFYQKCWSFVVDNSEICFQGKTKVYNSHSGNLKIGDVIQVVVDRIKGVLSFSIIGIDYGIAYSNIPQEEELYPTEHIYGKDNSVELIM